MQVKCLRKALDNLDRELAYIAKDDPSTARMVARRVSDSVSLLADNPGMGRPGRIPGTQELVVPETRYIIPYRVRPRMQVIEILRVFHASRKLPEHW